MPVYNAGQYLKEAINSILYQTLKEFELIIVDDGSTDNSVQLIQQFATYENRIKIISREHRGIVNSLNEALQFSQGRYIARMDADDIALPDRLEKQFTFLQNNPSYGVVGSWVQLFGEKNDIWHHRQFDNFIKNMLFYKTSGFSHSAVMLRKKVYDQFTYQNNAPHLEDVDLFMRIARESNWMLYNLPEVLLQYRVTQSQISHLYKQAQEENYIRLISQHIASYGHIPTQNEMKSHMMLVEQRSISLNQFEQVVEWIEKLSKILSVSLPDHYLLHREKLLQLSLKCNEPNKAYSLYSSSILCDYSKVCFIKEKKSLTT